MARLQNLLFGHLLQLDLHFSCPHLVTCVEMLFLVCDLEKAERVIYTSDVQKYC